MSDHSNTPQQLYGEHYYENYRSGSGLPYSRISVWLNFFGSVADRIVKDIGPRTVLDVGCAKAFLVEALRDRGVDAYGLDVSEYAIGQVRDDVRGFCWVASAAAAIPGRYDLAVCIEVLEHLAPAEAEAAVANLCAVTDDVLFSSTPDDDGDSTHVNVQPVEHWADLFARQGFYRDVDFDASFVARHAARFRRRGLDMLALVREYDRGLWRRLLDVDVERRRNQGLQEETARLQMKLAEAEHERQRLDGQRLWADAERQRLAGERQHLADVVALMESTVGWMVLQRGRLLRDRIAPPGTTRADAVRTVSRAARTLLRRSRAKAEVSLGGTARRRGGPLRSVLLVSGSGGDMERYRCHNTAEQLGLQGLATEVRKITDSAVPDLLPQYDLLLLHRVAYAEIVEELVAQAHQLGIAVLMDIDDRVFEPELASHIDALRWMDEGERALFAEGIARCRRSLLLCDGALVTTEPLVEAVRRIDKPAWVHRNGPSLELLRLSDEARAARSADRDRVVVGYASGTRTHNRDFAEVESALERLLGLHPEVELWILGLLDLDERWSRWGDRVKRVPHVPWRELPKLLAHLDINLAPLERDNPFCEAKSELKYLEAGAVGVPTVASDVGAFRHAIRDGDNGLLVRHPGDWLAALERLVNDATARHEMGRRAYDDVNARYHPAVQGAKLFRTLEAARGRARDAAAAPAAPLTGDAPQGSKVMKEDALAHARLDGLRGLEIGAAAHNPFGLDTRNVAVPADWEFYANSQRDLGVEPARVNIWATADNIPVGNASQDFVITSHVVEHLPDLIGALVEWDRVVRDGGYIYMIVPLKGALAEDGPRPLTPVEHFVDDWRASAHTRSPRVRRAWRHVTSVDGALLARAHRSALFGALAKVVRSRLVHGRLGFATALARREPWDRHPTEGVPGGRGGHYHTFVPDTILSLVAWMRTEGLCDWTLTSREEVDGKVGNGFTLAFRVRVPRGCAGT